MGLPLIQVGIFASAVDSVSVSGVKFIGLNTGVDFRNSDKWRVTNNTIEGLAAETFRRAIGINAAGTSDSFIGFNTITHDGSSDDNSDKQFRGIELICFDCGVLTENNKLVENEIAINVPGADELSPISLFDLSAVQGGPIDVFNNKLIQNAADSIVFTPSQLIDFNVLE